MATTTEDRMMTFRLLATGGDLKGFRALEPIGGIDGAATTYFFQVKCIKCGEATDKDICLRPVDAQMILPHPGPCSHRVRRSSAGRYGRRHCYPTCYSTSHIVRKCKMCGSLGSIELVPSAATLPATGGAHVLTTLECIGYIPLSFSPGPNWTLTTVTGDEIEMELMGDKLLAQHDITTTNIIIVNGVKFILKA